MRILRHFAQGTEEWFQEHLGRVTASRAADVLDFTSERTLKNGETRGGAEGAKRRLYRLEKAAEILSGMTAFDRYVSPEMKAGTFSEPEARKAYELEEGVMVEEVGIVISDDGRCGFSPDGLVVGQRGAIEAKCPKTTTHLRWMEEGVIPEEHRPQLWFGLMVDEELDWIDFISRDGGMSTDPAKFGRILPKELAQFTIRLERAEAELEIDHMREATERFLRDVDATVLRIRAKAKTADPLPVPDLGGMGLTDEDLNAPCFGPQA